MSIIETASEDTVEATCPSCGRKFQMERIVLGRGIEPIRTAVCENCVKKEKQEKIDRENERRREALVRQWDAVCPPLYRSTDPRRLPQKELTEVMDWEYGPEGLLLVGPTGTGKTRAAYLLLMREIQDGHYVEAFDCAAFGHECVRRFREGTGEDWCDLMGRQAGIVFLDDLGKIPFTERVEAELFALIERRAANEVPIIATTNMTGADFEDKASRQRGGPMIRRMREFSQVVVFRERPAEVAGSGGQ